MIFSTHVWQHTSKTWFHSSYHHNAGGHTLTWPRWPRCCPSTRLLPGSGGSANTHPGTNTNDLIVSCRVTHKALKCYTQELHPYIEIFVLRVQNGILVCLPVTGFWQGAPAPDSLPDPCRQQTGPGVWDSGAAESLTPAQSQWSPVHCGIDTPISDGRFLSNQKDLNRFMYCIFHYSKTKTNNDFFKALKEDIDRYSIQIDLYINTIIICPF